MTTNTTNIALDAAGTILILAAQSEPTKWYISVTIIEISTRKKLKNLNVGVTNIKNVDNFNKKREINLNNSSL